MLCVPVLAAVTSVCCDCEKVVFTNNGNDPEITHGNDHYNSIKTFCTV
jgi:hypothetical protein